MKTASWGKICTFWQQFSRSERFPLWRHANPLKHPQHSCRCSPLLKRRCDWQFLSVVTDLPSSPLRRLNAPDSSRGSPSDRGVTCTPPRVTLAGECGFLFVLFAYLTHVGPWSQNGSWIWPSTLRSAAEQWAFLNKQHGAEKSFTFLSLSVSGAATCVRLLCDYRENCWLRFCVFLCVSTKEPVQKNSFVNSLFSPFVSLSQVVFRSFVALWVVDRWTWAFLVYINVIFLFRRMNIQLKPTKIGLHLHWLYCRPGFYHLGLSLIWT